MGKKKQEMSQVYTNSNNEFIFGENGGKGKHLSSFLKNLSLTGSGSGSGSGSKSGGSPRHSSSDFDGGRNNAIGGGSIIGAPVSSSSTDQSYKDINSSIYGNFGYSNRSGSNNNAESISKERISYAPAGSGISPIQRSFSGPVASVTDLGLNPSNSSINNHSTHRSASNHRRREKYADLDDDWDAGLEEVKPSTSPSHKNQQRATSLSSNRRISSSTNPTPMMDALYPDLTMINPSANAFSNSPTKQSMDEDDYKAKLEMHKINSFNTKYLKFKNIFSKDSIDIQNLRKLSWNGIPHELRAISWQILLGYLPTNKSRQSSTLKRKRQEYLEGLSSVNPSITFSEVSSTSQYNNSNDTINTNSSNSNSNTNSADKQLYHQINIDVKRTNPRIKLYAHASTQESLRKILFLWAVRHPASGYVQGINDLCTPFYQIFLGNYIWQLQRTRANDEDSFNLFLPGLTNDSGSAHTGASSTDVEELELLNSPDLMKIDIEKNFDPARLSAAVRSKIEADTYWCLSRLLENITDNYIHQQPGIIRQVQDLKNLITKIDLELLTHFEKEGIEFIQFSFRWMNCLLMRELSIGLIIRMWDTYLSESPLGFNNFHVYVCAAFLIKFSDELKQKDFQEILLFLQNPPTSSWQESDVELMLSEAFIWQSLYKNASAHLR